MTTHKIDWPGLLLVLYVLAMLSLGVLCIGWHP